MSDMTLGILRLTDGQLEVEPLDQDGERLLQTANEPQGTVRIRGRTEGQCPLEPEMPQPLSFCAALQDLNSARRGDIDTLILAQRMIRREILRERWQKGDLDLRDLQTLQDT